jgi:micrococcal nuclease
MEIWEVKDGDTFVGKVALPLGIEVTSVFRLIEADTWEVRGDERERGLLAEAAFKKMIEEAEVLEVVLYENGQNRGRGNFGRVLARVYADGVDVNQWLIDEGHATVSKYD